jgi:hypothetical protein
MFQKGFAPPNEVENIDSVGEIDINTKIKRTRE